MVRLYDHRHAVHVELPAAHCHPGDAAGRPAFEAAAQHALNEAIELLDSAPTELATTLVAYPHALADFEEYLDAADAVREALSKAGADGVLQVATFHPNYQFAGTDPDEVSNYTNRSPMPVIHLLREEDVSRAIEEHPDADRVPDDNVARFEALGIDKVRLIWAKWLQSSEK